MVGLFWPFKENTFRHLDKRVICSGVSRQMATLHGENWKDGNGRCRIKLAGIREKASDFENQQWVREWGEYIRGKLLISGAHDWEGC